MRKLTCRPGFSLVQSNQTQLGNIFQAQKGFLHAQLENSLTRNSKLESEVSGLTYELRNKESENQDLRNRVVKLEVGTNLMFNKKEESSW